MPLDMNRDVAMPSIAAEMSLLMLQASKVPPEPEFLAMRRDYGTKITLGHCVVPACAVSRRFLSGLQNTTACQDQ